MPDLDLIGIEDALPLSSAQQGMLFHSLSEPGMPGSERL